MCLESESAVSGPTLSRSESPIVPDNSQLHLPREESEDHSAEKVELDIPAMIDRA